MMPKTSRVVLGVQVLQILIVVTISYLHGSPAQ